MILKLPNIHLLNHLLFLIFFKNYGPISTKANMPGAACLLVFVLFLAHLVSQGEVLRSLSVRRPSVNFFVLLI